MKNTLHSPLCDLFKPLLKINKNILVLLLFSGFLLTSNTAHAQLPLFDNFESGWGNWNDGGNDCNRPSTTILNGNRVARLRDNTAGSDMFTDAINLTPYTSVTIDFIFRTQGLNNSNHDFWVQYDDGSGFTTVSDMDFTVDFASNNTEYSFSITLTSTAYSFVTDGVFRIRADFGDNNDIVYIDDINITGVSSSPANDNCANAISLVPDVICTTTLGTTIDATQSLSGCAGTADDDVWFSFTALNAQHTIEVDPTTLNDAVIQVFDNCGGTSLGCEDSTGGGSDESLTLTGLTIGNTYYVRVYSYFANVSNQGEFNICITSPPSAPANDNCANAITLASDVTCIYTNGTTLNATQSLSGCTGTADDDVWYDFTALNTQHTIEVDPTTLNDAVIQVFDNCGGTSLACEDSTGGGSNESLTLTGLTIGNTYYIRVYSYFSNPSNQGEFNICITSPPPCTEPTNQPTNLIFSEVDETSIEASFTAATSSPDNYLVVYSTSNIPPTISDTTTYTIGSSFSGYTVADNDDNTTFTVTGLTGATTYYFYIYSFNEACSGGPNYLTSSPLIGNETTDIYCTPVTTNPSRRIEDFSTTGGITNITNNNSGYSSSGYGDFTNLSASVYQGSALNFFADFNGNHGFAIWVDFNDDGDFFDTGEEVYNSNSSIDPVNASFTIPAAAPLGNHRMRILADRNSSSPSSPCTFSGATGEAEDYTLTVIAPPPCAQPTNQPTNIIFSNVDNSSLEGNFTAATSSPDSYLVIYSTSSIPPTINDTTTYTIGSSFSGYTVADNDSNTTFTLTGLTSDTTYYFYIYSYNEACVGGPDYLITTPLTGDETTDLYCIPSSTNSSRYIDDFSTTGGIDNISNLGSGFSTDGYGDFTSNFATYEAGSNLDFIADFDGGTFGFGIWVDYNNDGDFTDSGEQAYISGFYGDPINATFFIPYSVASGSYRMRILADWIDSTPAPCSIGGSGGEAEDYILVVTNGCTTSTALGTSDLGCPFIEVGGLGLDAATPPTLECSIGETTIEATYLELGDTSSYLVEDIDYVPPFQFSCLENPVSVNLDDVWSPEIALPFDFCFYGNEYNSFVISSNGVISFDASLASGPAGWRTTRDIPNAVNASNGGGTGYYFGPSIYGVHHDVDPSVGGQIGYQLITLDSGCQALVAAWSDVPMFYDNSILYSGMIVFYENTNIIEVYVKEKNIDGTGSGIFGSAPWNEGNASIGLQRDNTTGTVVSGKNTLEDPNWTATEEAWRFVPNGASITDLKWYENSISAANEIIDINDDNQLVVTPSETTTYFAEVTYTLCDNSTIVETNSTTVTIEGLKTWNGSVSSSWSNPNNWTPIGVPVSTDCITIPNTAIDPVMTSVINGVGYNLEIEDGASLIQQSNATLTIEDAITIEPNGDLEVRDSASIIQITDVDTNKNDGTAKVQRRVAGIGNYDYVYWSSPVDIFDVEDISPGTPNSGIYKWTPTMANGTAGLHGNWVSTSEDMDVGKGYIVRGLTGNTIASTAEFNGKLNNGKISYPISRGTYTGANYPGIGNTSTAEDDNWNLLGNPYPSAISLKDFVLANPAIDGTLYFWQHLTPLDSGNDNPFYEGFAYNYSPNDYLAANDLGSTPPGFNGFIASGQGFFALMLDSAPTTSNVSYNNTMRGTYANDGFFRSASTTEDKHRIWLDLVNEDNIALSTLVGFANGATNDIDRLYDGFLMNQTGTQFYSIASEQRLTIQGRALPFIDTETVPLGYKASSAGNYTISINQVDGLFDNADQGIYLEDTELNIIHDLRANPYGFITELGTFDDRFILRFTNQSLSIKDQHEAISNLDIRSINNAVQATSKTSSIKSFELHDITGRLIHKNLNVENTNYSYQTDSLSTGTYIVTVSLTNGATVSKKLII